MNEILGIHERVELSIKIGESHYREFKSAMEGRPSEKIPRALKDIKEDIAKTLVAFANADGGELLIGVEDDGEISGLPFDGDKLHALEQAYLTNVHCDTPLPKPMVGVITIQEKRILYFNIPKGEQYAYLTSDGRCLKRLDLESIPVSAENIQAERLEGESRAWDRQVEPGLTLAALNLDLLKEVSSQIAYGVTPEKCLQHLGLADFTPNGLRLRRAAAILFAKEVRDFHPGCFVRIMTVNGQEKRSGESYNIVKDDIVSGNVMELIEASWERLSYALTMHTSLTENAKFQQSYLYPQIACREALINAIVHRNYAIQGRGVEISIYKDRLEIVSPGRLLSTISLEDIQSLRGVHESRNPLIARVLRETGYVREMGEGIRRIFDVMRSHALAEPEFSTTNNDFHVVLFHRSMYDPKVKLWLSAFDGLKLTEAQTAVLALGYGGKEFSTQDIIERLGLVDVDKVREIITPLRHLGLMETTKTDMQVHAFSRKERIPKRAVPRWKILSPSQSPTSVKQIDATVDAANQSSTEIYIGGLDYNTSSTAVIDFLSKYVDIESVNMPKNTRSGSVNKGFCFVVISADKHIDEIVAKLDQQVLDGRKIVVQQSRRKSVRAKS